jgi:hypothetical protein
VEHVVTFGLEHRVLGQIDAIGVDEIQYAKGHKYLTLVYQIDLGVTRLLWVGRETRNNSRQVSRIVPAWRGEMFSVRAVFADRSIHSPRRHEEEGSEERRLI